MWNFLTVCVKERIRHWKITTTFSTLCYVNGSSSNLQSGWSLGALMNLWQQASSWLCPYSIPYLKCLISRFEPDYRTSYVTYLNLSLDPGFLAMTFILPLSANSAGRNAWAAWLPSLKHTMLNGAFGSKAVREKRDHLTKCSKWVNEN